MKISTLIYQERYRKTGYPHNVECYYVNPDSGGKDTYPPPLTREEDAQARE